MNTSPEIKAITFDVGGTLLQPWPSVGDVYAEVAARHGRMIQPAALNQRFGRAWRARKQFQHSRDEWAALVDETFAGLLERPPSETFFPELYDRFAEPEAWRVFDDVRPTLDALAGRGLNLGIISNWDERLRPLLAKLDLAKYFEVIIISCEVGFPKPSPVIFEQAAKKLGLAPEFILHIGDSDEHDIKGAIGAGYQARLVDRGAHEAATGKIHTLAELERIMTSDVATDVRRWTLRSKKSTSLRRWLRFPGNKNG